MHTALDVIRKKAHEAHASQELLAAEGHYRTLLEKEPRIDDVINLGALLRSQGRLKEGSHFYKSWINKFEDDSRLILNACNCWNDNNEAQLTADFLEKFLKKKRAQKQLLLCYADSLNRINRLDECTEILKKCISNNPEDKEIWIRIGLCYAKGGRLNQALDAFNQANRIDPEELEVIANRITILKDLGRFEDANSLINGLTIATRLDVDICQATAGLLLAENKLVEASNYTIIFAQKGQTMQTIGLTGLQPYVDYAGQSHPIDS